MQFAPGQTALHYRIVDKIGEGGMGVVWKAVDTDLDRQVAIKVLPQAFAADSERLARFEREARLLASLNHPSIAAIYGLHETGGTRFLAMEFVEGNNLAEHLARGRLPVDEAVEFAVQVAEALESAHEQGVVHRDLKPANIQVTTNGRIKVLDFGLAKALAAAPDSADPSLSPTITSAGSRAGMVLGTAAYMSPEQARGKPVDRRADIWSFGCVLYEMLAGRPPHRGDTVSETLAAVLRDDVDLDALPSDTPPALRRLLGRCLDRDPRTRLQAIGEARVALSDRSQDPPVEPGRPAAGPRSSASRAWIAIALTSLLAGLAIGTLAPWRSTVPTVAPEVSPRSFVLPAPGRTLDDTQAISPDGKWIAYTAGDALWIRNLSDLDAREVPGSAGTYGLFWSPRSDAVAFAAGGSLFRASLQGGRPIELCSISGGDFTGGSWSEAGGIVFTTSRANWDGDVLRLPEEGGRPERFTAADPDRQERRLFEPQFLPDGRTLLYTLITFDSNNGEIAVDRDGVRSLVGLGNGSRQAAWSPTGHIVYTRIAGVDHSLWAVPFSLDTLTKLGEPFRIVKDGSEPSIASDGTLVYGLLHPEPQQLVWVDREGTVLGALGEPLAATLWSPTISPDGRRVAASIDWDWISVWDVDRAVSTRMTGPSEAALYPSWHPDGEEIAFMTLGASDSILVRRADGSGDARVLLKRSGVAAPSYSPDGKHIAFYVVDDETTRDLWAIDLSKPDEPFVLLRTPANEALPRISPDGKFVAYQSDSSGRWEVYVQPFPRGDGRWQISINGGQEPLWNPQGGEIFFAAGDELMTATVSTEPDFRIGKPQRLFSADAIETSFSLARYLGLYYDVAPDGERFIVVKGVRMGRSDLVLAEGVLAHDDRTND